jgi:hypothetical protein
VRSGQACVCVRAQGCVPWVCVRVSFDSMHSYPLLFSEASKRQTLGRRERASWSAGCCCSDQRCSAATNCLHRSRILLLYCTRLHPQKACTASHRTSKHCITRSFVVRIFFWEGHQNARMGTVRAAGAFGLLALWVGTARSADVDCVAAGFTEGLECSSCKALPEFDVSVWRLMVCVVGNDRIVAVSQS